MLDCSKSFPGWVRLHSILSRSKLRYYRPTHTFWQIFWGLHGPHESTVPCSDDCWGLGYFPVRSLWCGVLASVEWAGDNRRAAEMTALLKGALAAALLWVVLPTVFDSKRKMRSMWGSAVKGVSSGTWMVMIQALAVFTSGVYARVSTAFAPHS